MCSVSTRGFCPRAVPEKDPRGWPIDFPVWPSNKMSLQWVSSTFPTLTQGKLAQSHSGFISLLRYENADMVHPVFFKSSVTGSSWLYHLSSIKKKEEMGKTISLDVSRQLSRFYKRHFSSTVPRTANLYCSPENTAFSPVFTASHAAASLHL